MKKLIAFSVSLVCFFNTVIISTAAGEPSVSARSAVVMIAATGEVLYEKNAYEQRGIASTTKILTCITALENASLNKVAVATKEAVYVEGTSMGLKPGYKVDLLTLIKGMLLESGNDAANVTAQLISGSKEKFAVLMNETSKKIGMHNSSFKNPSGLTEDGHYSCAYDMALLGSYAIKNTVFSGICSSKKCTVKFLSPETEVTFYNHNKLLSRYEGAFGIKTGFTKASGRCLVSAVRRNGITLVCVTLNAYDDWNDHIKLYDYCFPEVSEKEIELPSDKLSVAVVNSSKKSVALTLSKKLYIPYTTDVASYETVYYIPQFVYAGVNKGDYLGEVELYTEKGILIDKAYLIANENATQLKPKEAKQKTLFEKILNFTEKDCR